MVTPLKILSSTDYLNLFRTLAISPKPLSIQEIRTQLPTQAGRAATEAEIYQKIANLHDSDTYFIRLFKWDDVPGNTNVERKILSVYNQYLKKFLTADLNEGITFQKSTVNEITILKDNMPIIKIKKVDDHLDKKTDTRKYGQYYPPKILVMESLLLR
jgi:hypothetical protein